MKSCKNAANLNVNNMAPTYMKFWTEHLCDLHLGGPKVKKLRPALGVLLEKISIHQKQHHSNFRFTFSF